jgi:hypothetical protein
VPEAQPPFDEDTISIRVVSEPPGADVLLAGKPIGTTPLDTRLPKGAGPAFLTVRRSKFHEVTTRIDLAGDFTKEVTLKPIDDQADDRKKADEERKRLDAKRLEEQRRLTEQKRQDELKKQQDAKRPRCQDPGRINPFDTNCLGLPTATNANGACPPCKEFK